MRLGVVILQDEEWHTSARKWRLADELGFDHAWVYDHLGWRDLVSGPWFDGLTILALAATVTNRVQLGTNVLSPNLRHPAVVARSLVTIDRASGGRLLLGIGSGGSGYDEDVLGLPRLSRLQKFERYREFVSILQEILSPGPTTVSGEYFSVVEARSTPGSGQAFHAPMILAGAGTSAIRFAATVGDGWMTNGVNVPDRDEWWRALASQSRSISRALDEAGRDSASFRRYLSLDPGPGYSFESVEFFEDSVGRAAELGFTDVVSSWPRSDGWFAGSEDTMMDCMSAFRRNWRD